MTISWDCNYPPSITGFNTYFSACGTTSVDFFPETSKFTTIYPNPASEKTTVDFYLDKVSAVSIDIYNVAGQKVHSTAAADIKPGFNYAVVPLGSLSNGIYIVKLIEGDQAVDMRMLSVTR